VTLAAAWIAAALAAATGAAPATGAVTAAPRPPVRVDADEVLYSYKDRTATFVGKPIVRLTREDAVLLCSRLLAENDAEGKIARATCSGDVKLTRGTRVVTCVVAVYVEATASVTCPPAAGRTVTMVDGPSTVKGLELVYDLDRDLVTLKGQVAGDLVPKNEPVPAKKKAKDREASR
jgi:lipopolysaccharide export system protein LptA